MCQDLAADTSVPHERSATLRHWYALYTYPRHEKRAAESLGLYQIETFLPLYKVVHRWKNRCTRTVDLPLFPRYLFARFTRVERLQVLGLKSVVSIVGNGHGTGILSDADVEALRDGLPLRNAEPHPYLAVGERARIRSGALAGMEGIVVRKKNSLRVVLTLDLIMQSVSLEVDGADLEPLGMSNGSARWGTAPRTTLRGRTV